MMAIVVINIDAVPCPHMREATLDAAKPFERLADHRFTDTHLPRRADGREAVEHIVTTGHGQRQAGHLVHLARLAVSQGHIECVLTFFHARIGSANISLRAGAVCDDATITHATDQRLHFRVVDAHDRTPIEGHILDKGEESIAGGVEGAVVIQMLRINVGDDGNG